MAAGWSKAGAARQGRPWRPAGDRSCYYCGVENCTECGQPPAMLTQSGIIPAAGEQLADPPCRKCGARAEDHYGWELEHVYVPEGQ